MSAAKNLNLKLNPATKCMKRNKNQNNKNANQKHKGKIMKNSPSNNKRGGPNATTIKSPKKSYEDVDETSHNGIALNLMYDPCQQNKWEQVPEEENVKANNSLEFVTPESSRQQARPKDYCVDQGQFYHSSEYSSNLWRQYLSTIEPNTSLNSRINDNPHQNFCIFDCNGSFSDNCRSAGGSMEFLSIDSTNEFHKKFYDDVVETSHNGIAVNLMNDPVETSHNGIALNLMNDPCQANNLDSSMEQVSEEEIFHLKLSRVAEWLEKNENQNNKKANQDNNKNSTSIDKRGGHIVGTIKSHEKTYNDIVVETSYNGITLNLMNDPCQESRLDSSVEQVRGEENMEANTSLEFATPESYQQQALSNDYCVDQGQFCHSSDYSPYQWRQYHSTIEPNTYPNSGINNNPRQYCCICDCSGSFFDNCRSAGGSAEYLTVDNINEHHKKSYDDVDETYHNGIALNLMYDPYQENRLDSSAEQVPEEENVESYQQQAPTKDYCVDQGQFFQSEDYSSNLWRQYLSTIEPNTYTNRSISYNPRQYCCICDCSGSFSDNCRSAGGSMEFLTIDNTNDFHEKLYDDFVETSHNGIALNLMNDPYQENRLDSSVEQVPEEENIEANNSLELATPESSQQQAHSNDYCVDQGQLCHSEDYSPDLWRQYHSTIESNTYSNSRINDNPRQNFCIVDCNGSFSDNCRSAGGSMEFLSIDSTNEFHKKFYDDVVETSHNGIAVNLMNDPVETSHNGIALNLMNDPCQANNLDSSMEQVSEEEFFQLKLSRVAEWLKRNENHNNKKANQDNNNNGKNMKNSTSIDKSGGHIVGTIKSHKITKSGKTDEQDVEQNLEDQVVDTESNSDTAASDNEVELF